MKIIDFVKKLLPTLEKRDVLEDLRVTIAELENIAISSYSSAVDYFKINKVDNKQLKDMTIAFYKALDDNSIVKQANMVAEISIRLPNVRDNAVYIKELIEKLMSEDILSESIDAKKATLMRAAGDISYLSRYTADLLNYVLAIESNTVDTIPPATIKYIERNFKQFVYLLSDYGVSNKIFSKIIDKVPDVVIGGDSGDKASALYASSDIDPLETSYINNFSGSPIYHIRLAIADWQSKRYKASKDKKKVLELRILQLKSINENKNDAKLEREIEYTQSRVDKADRYLRSVEEDLGI